MSRYEVITLAHEIVHAAGRSHIRNLPDEVEKLISTLSKVTGVSKTILSKNLYPGYFDGAPNDIINYNSKGHKPDDVILTNDDKTRLEIATFVKDTS